MKLKGNFHTAAPIPPGKELSVTFGWEAGWAPEIVWTLEIEKTSAFDENPTQIPQSSKK
jgi:hypothetical protein